MQFGNVLISHKSCKQIPVPVLNWKQLMYIVKDPYLGSRVTE